MAQLNASWVNHPWNLMVSCGKYGPLEAFCLHASVLCSVACVCSTSSLIWLLWENIKEENQCLLFLIRTINTINSGDHLPIKVWWQLFKTWHFNRYCAAMKSLPCCITSYAFFSFWMTLLSGVDSLTTAGERRARSPHYTVVARAFVACRNTSVGNIVLEEYCL